MCNLLAILFVRREDEEEILFVHREGEEEFLLRCLLIERRHLFVPIQNVN